MDALAGFPEKSSTATTFTSQDCGRPKDATLSLRMSPCATFSGPSRETTRIHDGFTFPMFFGWR